MFEEETRKYCIDVEDLCKSFKIYDRPRDRLTEILLRKPRHTVYDALSDISFKIQDGDNLGIIGDNGAGKSTLLKILAGTLQPTAGSIQVKGQVAALLELGAGFHPEFTGRRNIYLNASLLGVPDDNIAEIENDVIEFSELDYFIDRPVKTYSSGMFVRLAFSIATMVRPDILVIDEALSVGDMAFQSKCVERMNQFRAERKTMVFCSHSMYHIQQLCDTAIWLHKGRVREIGPSEEIVAHYEDFCTNKKVYNSIVEDTPEKKSAPDQQDTEVKSKDCRILNISVQSEDGSGRTSIVPLSDIILKMEVEFLKDDVEGYFGFAFMRTTDEVIASWLTTEREDILKGPFQKGDRYEISVKVKNVAMRSGNFYVLGAVADRTGLLWSESRFSKPISMEATKGVGQLIMAGEWDVKRKT